MDLLQQLEAEQAYESLRSPSLQTPRFRDKPVATLLRAMGIDRSARKRRAWQYAERIVLPVCLHEPAMRGRSNEELRALTPQLRARLAAGETLDELLPEAFALVREVSRRVMGLRHYDVQLIGGAVLHEGNVAEMGTGEGKTLVATLAVYLNALPQLGSVYVVTVNEYLAKRDATVMGRLYRALGLSCGCVLAAMSTAERVSNAGYGADVTYITAQELGFDYLRDASALHAGDLRQLRPYWFAIVDEVDSILIDEARNPMLMSRPFERSISRFSEAHKVAMELVKDADYSVNLLERNVLLTDAGIATAEHLLGVDDLFLSSDSWASKVTDAVMAKELYERDVHYLVRGNEVVIIDIATGRTRRDSRWAESMHQAIEAKEGLEVKAEQLTIATITYQSFFKLFPKLAGMSGTAANEVSELFETYGMDVVSVPPNKPLQRIDMPFNFLFSEHDKWDYVAGMAAYWHSRGVPCMIGTPDVYLSDVLSERLTRFVWKDQTTDESRLGIPHNLLNARPENVAQEAAIVAQAGRIGAVTIATNMAGRGTDILLGGNPMGLTRAILEEDLFPAFGLDTPPSLSNTGAPMELSEAVLMALDRAVQAAKYRCRKGETYTAADVHELIDIAMERAETKKLEDSESVLEDTLAFAAHWILSACRAQCESDAAFVRNHLGGLQVVGTCFSDSQRIDAQLRGRAGRQGDPGASFIVLSTEDRVFEVFREMPGIMYAVQILADSQGAGTAIMAKIMMPAIRNMQRSLEERARSDRQYTAKYDAVLHVHREVVLGLRRKVLLEDAEQRRVRFFRFFEEMVDEALDTMHFDVITPPSKWAIKRLLGMCRRLTASYTKLEGKDRALINFLPGVLPEEISQALEYGTELPLGRKLPPLSAHPMTLTMMLLSDGAVDVVDAGVPDSDYEDAEKAAAAAAQVLALNIERRIAAQPPPILPLLVTYAPAKARLRAFFIEYLEMVYRDRVERFKHKGLPEYNFDDIGRMQALVDIDEEWGAHLAEMTVIRYSAQLSTYGVQDPLVEYTTQGRAELASLMCRLRKICIRSVFVSCNPSKWRTQAELLSDDAARQHRDWLDLATKLCPDYEVEKIYEVVYLWRVIFAFACAFAAFLVLYPKAMREAEEIKNQPPASDDDVAAVAAAVAAACAAALGDGDADIDTPAITREDARG
jgi:preprotein translocase subunit SecA